jgi:hypothetical protein
MIVFFFCAYIGNAVVAVGGAYVAYKNTVQLWILSGKLTHKQLIKPAFFPRRFNEKQA